MNGLSVKLKTLARLLEYPAGKFETEMAALCRVAATPALNCIVVAMSALTPAEREELYTATFDIPPACVPYVSLHLFGEENFKRGELMAALLGRYRQAGFDPAGELPDHLAVLLRYAAQADEAERRELVEFCLLGPAQKMIAALPDTNPYRTVLEAVRETLQAAYPGLKPALSPLEQMQNSGAGCALVSSGCHCGAVAQEEKDTVSIH